MATTTDLNLIPAIAAPKGLTSNFSDAPSLMHMAIAVTTVTHCITLPFIVARVYVNAVIVKEFRMEDLLAYLSYAGLIVYTTLGTYAASIGGARHMWDISLANFIRVGYYSNIILITMTITTCLAKSVVFLQLKRIFTTQLRDAVFWIITGSIVVNLLFYTIMLFLYIFSCTPREKIWNPLIPGQCINTTNLLLAGGTLNVVSDVEALLVPAWAIWRLSMHIKKKLAVFVVFGIGIIAIVIGIIGLYWRTHLIEGLDYTWILTQLATIGMAENAAVIIVGCCPSIPRLVRHVRGHESTNGRYVQERRESVVPKHTPKLNTFHKYITKDTNLSRIESRFSEEHLQLHEYPKSTIGRSSSERRASMDGDTSGEIHSIGQTTKSIQTTSINSAIP